MSIPKFDVALQTADIHFNLMEVKHVYFQEENAFVLRKFEAECLECSYMSYWFYFWTISST